jgi:1-aminocyclopropane-1-carboxylate deaminase/D-cysteine desulfhydrase-like pyridoxal-dependent ACC family enzyme
VLGYTETSVRELKSHFLSKHGVALWIKREDQNHPYVSGNKWWKLKYNIEKVIQDKHDTVLTFGGAYSNHIYATAAAAQEVGVKSIGVIRGEEVLPLNPTLAFAKRMGMHLHYVNREAYKSKSNPDFFHYLQNEFGHFYLIPEGGTNAPAIKGCEEWALKLVDQYDFDYLCLPVGTGGTMAGMANVIQGKIIIGFSSLKGGSFLNDEVGQWTNQAAHNWEIATQYHFGGYGKVSAELINFIKTFEAEYHIPLDPVYTAKMMFGILDLIKQNKFEIGSKILALHTGGLQGRTGFSF